MGVTSAPALASSAAAPSVTSFQASPASLPASGGSVKLAAKVKHASTCTFGSTPALHGLPVKVSCSSGQASRTVKVPANTSAASVRYSFTLTVKGPGGTAKAKPATVMVREAPPAVTFTATPDGLPAAGGHAVLNVTVRRSVTCVFSVTPAVSGFPVTKACAAGSTADAVSVPVTLPVLTGTASRKYTFTLAVTGPGGTTKSTASETVWPTPTWSAPKAVDAPGGTLGPVSCVSATFCMALDPFGGYALTFNGKSWSAPVRIEQGPYPDTGYIMTLSCATTTFCVAADLGGNAFTYNGASWKASSTGISASDISCASPAFCMAINSYEATTYNGTSWSAPATVSANDQLVSVSCPTASFCLAVSSLGNSYAYDGSGWGGKTPFDTAAADVSQVSCASSSLCVAIDQDGLAAVYTGTWSAPTRLAVAVLDSVSCPSVTFCLVDGGGTFYAFNGKKWSTGQDVDAPQAGDVSCASATSCMMIDDNGTVYILAGTTWSYHPQPNGPRHGFTYAVSCPTSSFCAATDWTGAYVTYNGKSWSAPRQISPTASQVDSVSCTGATFCMAVDVGSAQGGDIYTYNGSSWTDLGAFGYELTSVSCTSRTFCMVLAALDGSVYAMTWNGSAMSWPPALVDSGAAVSPQPGVGFVSCASRSFCAAADAGGNVLTFNGTAWSAPDTIDAGTSPGLDAVSCPSASFCTAIDGWGQAFSFNGKTWSGPAGLESDGDLQAISCTSSHFCAAVDLSGNSVIYNGATWSSPSYVDPAVQASYGLTGVSCPLVSFCAAVDWEGNALTATG